MTFQKLCFAVLALAVTIATAEVTKFNNYRVYSLNVTSEEQLTVLRQLEQSSGYDFWRSAELVGTSADVMVAPHKAAEFAGIVGRLQLEPQLMVEDVQRLINNQKVGSGSARLSSSFDWKGYHNLETIYAWLDEQLAAYPTILSAHVVGQSFENRTIRAVKLSHKAGNPVIFIEANIHAREWITSATATWLLNELLTSSDPAVTDLARNIDWVIVPVFNVDGFEYSHRVNRLWRKTRQPHGHICYGADANRNFGEKWMEIGASQNICAETYAGPAAWSEPETRALAAFLDSFADQVKVYLSFHSYGQYFMFPYGHTSEPAPDYDALMAVSEKFKEAVAVKYGTVYRVGPSSTTIYETSGSSVDWVYANQSTTLVYTIEFRDRGAYGFLLPVDQIVPNCLETLDGLLAMVREGRAQNLL